MCAEIVNPQITDAVTQSNVKVVSEAPAMAMGSLYQTIGNSVAMAAANAVYAQQQANVTYQAATVNGVISILGSQKASGETVQDIISALGIGKVFNDASKLSSEMVDDATKILSTAEKTVADIGAKADSLDEDQLNSLINSLSSQVKKLEALRSDIANAKNKKGGKRGK